MTKARKKATTQKRITYVNYIAAELAPQLPEDPAIARKVLAILSKRIRPASHIAKSERH